MCVILITVTLKRMPNFQGFMIWHTCLSKLMLWYMSGPLPEALEPARQRCISSKQRLPRGRGELRGLWKNNGEALRGECRGDRRGECGRGTMRDWRRSSWDRSSRLVTGESLNRSSASSTGMVDGGTRDVLCSLAPFSPCFWGRFSAPYTLSPSLSPYLTLLSVVS